VGCRGLVFDFDGLLLETEEPLYRAWAELFQEHGLELTIEEWGRALGTVDAFDPEVEIHRRSRTRPADDLGRRWRARRDELMSVLEPAPGAADLLRRARDQGLALAVASSSRRDWVENHLRRLGMLAYFDYLSCYDGRVPAKPAPDLYAGACAGLGVSPPQAVAFEDSYNGLLSAKAAGLRCVVVPTAMTAHMDFSQADLVIASLEEVDLEALRSGAGGQA
jgi:HAD superfamily hydrolase (TIGR01509 family)